VVRRRRCQRPRVGGAGQRTYSHGRRGLPILRQAARRLLLSAGMRALRATMSWQAVQSAGGGAAVGRASSRCGRRRRDRLCFIPLLYGALCLEGAACGQACLASAARARQHCGLTPRSRGDPARRGALGPHRAVAGSIVLRGPRAPHLTGRLSSNVRPQIASPCQLVASQTAEPQPLLTEPRSPQQRTWVPSQPRSWRGSE
jgi:hypothetical protein